MFVPRHIHWTLGPIDERLISLERSLQQSFAHKTLGNTLLAQGSSGSGDLSNREKLGMDQVFVVYTSKSGLNQMGLVF